MVRTVKVEKRIQYLSRGGLSVEEISKRMNLTSNTVEAILQGEKHSIYHAREKQKSEKDKELEKKVRELHAAGKTQGEVMTELRIYQPKIASLAPDLDWRKKGAIEERNKKIVEKREAGKKLIDIASELNIPLHTVNQVVTKFKGSQSALGAVDSSSLAPLAS